MVLPSNESATAFTSGGSGSMQPDTPSCGSKHVTFSVILVDRQSGWLRELRPARCFLPPFGLRFAIASFSFGTHPVKELRQRREPRFLRARGTLVVQRH